MTKWREVSRLICDRKMSFKLKSKIYKMKVTKVHAYSSDCWLLRKTQEQILNTAERKKLKMNVLEEWTMFGTNELE